MYSPRLFVILPSALLDWISHSQSQRHAEHVFLKFTTFDCARPGAIWLLAPGRLIQNQGVCYRLWDGISADYEGSCPAGISDRYTRQRNFRMIFLGEDSPVAA